MIKQILSGWIVVMICILAIGVIAVTGCTSAPHWKDETKIITVQDRIVRDSGSCANGCTILTETGETYGVRGSDNCVKAGIGKRINVTLGDAAYDISGLCSGRYIKNVEVI
jgi:hypothetical protein